MRIIKNPIKVFVGLNFIVSFLSDVILNDLSYLPKTRVGSIIKSLNPYFREKSIVGSGILAGLTVVSVLYILLYLTNWKIPETWRELFKLIFIAFPIGFIADIVIDKSGLFGPTLVPYYEVAGSGLWGAIAFIFSIIISFIIYKIIPYL
jgi:hypothetical protein